jgi:hypothetical protein
MQKQAIKFALVAAIGLTVSGPAAAQDGMLRSIGAAAGSLWDMIRTPFARGSSDAVTPPTPISVATRAKEGGSEFWDGLRDAGYELREIITVVGVIPEAKLNFQLVRELSDADRDALERRIEIDEQRRGGLTAVLQRQILRTLLSVSNVDEMRITKLDITLLPLPSAEFVMEPAEAPLGEEHDAILRAVQGHSQEVIRMQRGMMPGRTDKTPMTMSMAPAETHD